MVGKMFDSLTPGSLILDAGCGIGNITGKYCHKYSIIGIDEQASAIHYCQEHYSGKYIKTNFFANFAKSELSPARILSSLVHCRKPLKKFILPPSHREGLGGVL